MSMTFIKMMPPMNTRTYNTNHHRNNLNTIINSLTNGNITTIRDTNGNTHRSPVQAIRKHGTHNYWLITVKGIEICAKAA
jgi:hypothetical protein